MVSRVSSPLIHRALVAGCLGVGLLALVGCGPDLKTRGVVKGKVTKGKTPLTTGSVTFWGPYNITSTAVIDENGDYVMNDAPIGEVTITVAVNAPMGMGPGPKDQTEKMKKIAGEGSKDPEGNHPQMTIMPKTPKNVVRIDEKYSKPESSGLKFTVQKGEQTHNIEL